MSANIERASSAAQIKSAEPVVVQGPPPASAKPVGPQMASQPQAFSAKIGLDQADLAKCIAAADPTKSPEQAAKEAKQVVEGMDQLAKELPDAVKELPGAVKRLCRFIGGGVGVAGGLVVGGLIAAFSPLTWVFALGFAATAGAVGAVAAPSVIGSALKNAFKNLSNIT